MGLLENSKKLVEKLEEEVTGMKKLKERYSSIMFKLSDLQKGRAAIARNMSDTKIILERIIAAQENYQVNANLNLLCHSSTCGFSVTAVFIQGVNCSGRRPEEGFPSVKVGSSLNLPSYSWTFHIT